MDPVITPDQYRAAIDALGLDPDLIVSVTLSGAWVSITQITVSPEGVPLISLGQHVTHTSGGPLVDEVTE